ncbi:MAG: xanthine phosphoribosyltransferase [Chloroflexi bacterium]|nr:xanthine phosphoribosyltransferase [Chloroflexota bacterium]
MESLKARILAEGRNMGRGILKVDSFVNHQVDAALMYQAGQALARRFVDQGVTKVLTAEISGIAPALMTALALGVPIVYARKTKPITMPEQIYVRTAPSHTKGHEVALMVSPEFLGPGDRVLIVDDFLATGKTIDALVQIVRDAGAELVGIGAVIEKTFEGGRAVLERYGVPIYALVTITSMENGKITFANGVGQ